MLEPQLHQQGFTLFVIRTECTVKRCLNPLYEERVELSSRVITVEHPQKASYHNAIFADSTDTQSGLLLAIRTIPLSHTHFFDYLGDFVAFFLHFPVFGDDFFHVFIVTLCHAVYLTRRIV
jgi:hypothetical protein